MKGLSKNFYLSIQLVLALTVLLGVSPANAKQTKKFAPTYKAEKCDCIGFSDNIPTFLSDLTGGGVDIYGEGNTKKAAEEKAQNMCVETYRNFASVSESKEDSLSISHSGCHLYKSTPNGDWVSI